MNQKNSKQLATKKDLEKWATKEQLSKVATQVVKNSEEIKKMVTKTEFNKFRQEMLTGRDKMMTIHQRLDQE